MMDQYKTGQLKQTNQAPIIKYESWIKPIIQLIIFYDPINTKNPYFEGREIIFYASINTKKKTYNLIEE